MDHVAHAIAQHTTVPLVLVRGQGRAPISGPLLVGIDGSPGSAAAIRWAMAVARIFGREVVAVHGRMGSHTREQRAELEATCAEWTAPLRAAGVTSRVLIREGWPARVINDLEAVERPGLVVLGTRGAGYYHDLRLGSVPLQVLHHARIPVAVVPCPSGTGIPR